MQEMTQLEEIQHFISSPGFDVLTDDAKAELRHIEQELKSQEYDEECEELILAFKRIHRNKAKGCFAPHKPVLLLAVMDLIDTGHISSTEVHLDKELKDRFKTVWNQTVPVGCKFKCEYRNPFTYLNHEPFWNLCDDKNTAILSEIAFHCMSNPQKRLILRDSLVWMIKNETLLNSPRLYDIASETDSPKMVAESVLGIIPIIGLLMAV